MDADDPSACGRRAALRMAALAFPALALAGLARAGGAAAQSAGERRPMKIGVIGAGRIGGTLGTLWVKAGHEVLFSSRHPDELEPLVAPLGPRARAGEPRAAAAFGEVVLVSVPYAALPQIGRDYAEELAGKVVLDTCNPFPGRDGEMAVAAREKGAGIASAEYLAGTRLVRAFNSVGYGSLRSEAHREGERVAIPLASDHAEALAVAAGLVEDAGFEPVVVGPLARSRAFDPGTPVFGRAMTARELRRELGL